MEINEKIINFKKDILTLVNLLNDKENLNQNEIYQIKKIISMSSSIDNIENIFNVYKYYENKENIKDEKDFKLYEITKKEILNINSFFEEISKLVLDLSY